MAIAQMTKVMIVSHHSQASELLEALQAEGICQILNAEQAIVSRDFPDLSTANQQVDRPPRDIEQLINRLQRCIAFLKDYVKSEKGLAGVLSPRTIVDERSYNNVIQQSSQIFQVIEQCEQIQATIDKAKNEIENLHSTLETLSPWASLETPVEEIGELRTTTCMVGLIPTSHFEQVAEQLAELAGAIEIVGTSQNRYACIIVCPKENYNEAQKLLRSAEFEPVSFEPLTGTVAQLISQHSQKLEEAKKQLRHQYDKAAALSENFLNLQILHDHFANLLNREQTRDTAPATQHTVILEGWVRQKDFPRLEKIVSRFQATSLSKVEPAEDEEMPVEIENKKLIRPFEVITRLYGMPRHFEVDPTVFLAPFFALFFALCLTDAGYGLVIITLMIFFIKKVQGDKKLMYMLMMCAAVTVFTGALTGGWFGDAIQQFVPVLKPIRENLMWFDPLQDPMIFFKLALGLGYFQIITGLVIAFSHNISQKNYTAAICDQLTWLVMLNSIVLFLASKFGLIQAEFGKFFGLLAPIPAVVILLFSQRQGSWAGRLGMGLYNLFSTIFYMGDVLSYLRLMALGMVTAGLAMAINVIAKIAGQIPYGIGIIAMALVLICGHGFNIAINALGAFVHTLRLQYVEFFPKFIVGGGRTFEPLSRKYKHIYIKEIKS